MACVRRLFLLVLLFVPTVATGAPVQAKSYEISVRFTPAESRIEGRASISFVNPGSAVSSVRFWLHGELRVSAIEISGKPVDFEQSPELYRYDYALIGTHVTVPLKDGRLPERIDVTWSGAFHASAARSPSDYMRIDRDGVFLRAAGYSAWFPLILEPGDDDYEVAFPRVEIEVPAGMTAVFGGSLVSEEELKGVWRGVWRAPAMSLFDAQLTARPFDVFSLGDVRIYHLPDEASKAAASRIATFTRELLKRYRDRYRPDGETGEVHILEMPKFGDIASGNVLGLQESGWTAFGEEAYPQVTLAHEIVHPFVQPAVPRGDPLYALAIEGFPSYFHLPVLPDLIPGWSYEERIEQVRMDYEERRRTGLSRRGRKLPPEKPILAISPDEIGLYKDTFVLSDRALLFLDAVRSALGEDGFKTLTRELFSRPSLDLVTFREVLDRHAPQMKDRVTMWLSTTDLPPGPSSSPSHP